MKYEKLTITAWDILYQDRTREVKAFTPLELAGFKRSKKYKQILSKEKLFSIDVKLSINEKSIR